MSNNIFCIFICLVLIFNAAGCGYFLYPDRRGQTGGRLDVGIAILDGVGLFFFIIPGLIAYAVDFTSGTIYLPNSPRSSLDTKNLKEVKFDPSLAAPETIEKLVHEQTGLDVKPYRHSMKVSRLKSFDEMRLRFAEAYPGT